MAITRTFPRRDVGLPVACPSLIELARRSMNLKRANQREYPRAGAQEREQVEAFQLTLLRAPCCNNNNWDECDWNQRAAFDKG